MRARPTQAVLVIAAVLLSACSGTATASACQDPASALESSSLHVLPGVQVNYEFSPPTSGPHQIPAPEGGVKQEPVPEPQQIGAVETGMVLVQYADSVDASTVQALEALAEDDVIVAPGVRPFDDGATIAFSAWGVHQLCSQLDIEAAEAFISQRAGAFFVNHEN